jgi:DNA-binding XRE family transcriptional regulator
MAADVERLHEQAERIKRLRREKERRDGISISQETAAYAIGVSSRTYRTWEGQGATLQFDNLKALADYYETTTGYIEHGQHVETPDLSSDGQPAQLDRIEQKLDQVLSLLQAQEVDTAMEIHRAFEEMANRLGREVGKRPARSRANTGRSREAPPAAA